MTARPESLAGNNALLVLVTALCCVFMILGGDRVTAYDGLGWDGTTYALYIKKLNEITSRSTPASAPAVGAPVPADTSVAIKPPAASAEPETKHGLNPYYFHRLAPIVVVHAVLKALHLEHSNANIIRVFLSG